MLRGSKKVLQFGVLKLTIILDKEFLCDLKVKKKNA